MEFTFWDILRNLLLAARWTLGLSLAGFVCGSSIGLLVLVARISPRKPLHLGAVFYIELFQGTPLLLQLFLVFFGLPLIGLDVQPWMAAGLGLTLWASAYLGEIWRGCVEAIHVSQWDAAAALGLHRAYQFRLVILPQAARRIRGPVDQGHRVDVDHRVQRVAEDIECHHQCHICALHCVWRCGADLFCYLLPTHTLFQIYRKNTYGRLGTKRSQHRTYLTSRFDMG